MATFPPVNVSENEAINKGCIPLLLTSIILFITFTIVSTHSFRWWHARLEPLLKQEVTEQFEAISSGQKTINNLADFTKDKQDWYGLGLSIQVLRERSIFLSGGIKPGHDSFTLYPIIEQGESTQPPYRYWGLRLSRASGSNAHEAITARARKDASVWEQRPVRLVLPADTLTESKPSLRRVWSALPIASEEFKPYSGMGYRLKQYLEKHGNPFNDKITIVELFFDEEESYDLLPNMDELPSSMFAAVFPTLLITMVIMVVISVKAGVPMFDAQDGNSKKQY